MASTRLTRSITGSNSYKATFSAWLKLSGNADKAIFTSIPDGSNNFRIHITGTNQLQLKDYQSSSTVALLLTTQVFRDPGAFYHIVVSIDTSLGTADDRAKIYVNGTQVTSFASRTNYPVNNVPVINKTGTHEIGAVASGDYFDGLMSYMAVVDGTTYDATSFGETNAATGIWKFKSPTGLTYGTNGFFLKMDTSSPGADSSGEGNTFSPSGTPTLAQDNASNNLATGNSLYFTNSSWTTSLTNGNNTFTGHTGTNSYPTLASTIAMPSSGKWYAEFKQTSSSPNYYLGVTTPTNMLFTSRQALYPNYDSEGTTGDNAYSVYGSNFEKYIKENGGTNSSSSYGATVTTSQNDIMSIACDLDNNNLYFAINGVWHNSGDPESGSTGTGAISILNDEYLFFMGDGGGSADASGAANFGNGFFGVTAVTTSPAKKDGSGHGKFQYTVPTGYYTLNTKNLNTYGG